MRELLSRRNAMKVLAAGSLMGGASYGKSSVIRYASPTHRVNLICSGMMALVWQKDQFWIWMPVRGNAHAIRFGVLGGTNLPSNDYTLTIGGCPKPGPKYDADKKKDFVLDCTGGYPLTKDPAGVDVSIALPIPTSIRRFRFFSHGFLSFESFYTGNIVTTYQANPSSIPTVRILTYDLTCNPGPITFVDKGGNSFPGFPTLPSDSVQNIHLYSEPPAAAAHQDHLPMFNSMFKDSNGNHLDINSGKARYHEKKLAHEHVPDDLSRDDLATLAELGITLPANGPTLFNLEPADCISGCVFLPG